MVLLPIDTRHDSGQIHYTIEFPPRKSPSAMHHDTAEMTESAAHMATDPVCGMKVDIGARGPNFDHRGETYYFCSAGCKAKFEAESERASVGG